MATYRVVLHQSEEGFSVSCPGLPGCWSQGATREEALENVREAADGWLEAQQDKIERGNQTGQIDLITL